MVYQKARETVLKPLAETGQLPLPPQGAIESGIEWIIDASGCSPELLKSKRVLQKLFEVIVTDLGLNVIDSPQWHQFPGAGGITGLALLSESHLACHTYPEFQLLTLNLYCCRPRDEWPWKKELGCRFGAQQVYIRQVPRGEVPS